MAASFDLTIRCADGVHLGLVVGQDFSGEGLRIFAVSPGGAIDAWNKRMLDNGDITKVVHGKGRIYSINGHSSLPQMLLELESTQLFRMHLVPFDSSPNLLQTPILYYIGF